MFKNQPVSIFKLWWNHIEPATSSNLFVRFLRYVMALLVVALVAGIRVHCRTWIGEENPFLLFLAGVLFSSWLGGIGPGLFATVAAALLSDLFFLTPGQFAHENSFEANLQIGLFLVEGTVISLGTSALRRAILELRMADRHKDDFLAILAHEMRNHLTPIGYALAAMQAADKQPATVERSRAALERQLQQLNVLVDDLMDLMRIRSGKLQLRMERTELSQIVSDAVQTSRPLIERLGHDLTVTLPSRSCSFRVDAKRLVQALTNLLNNAAKYTEKRGRIELVANAVDGVLEIRVRDSGIGIDPELLPKVFDRFFQVNGGEVHSRGGIGIGLSLVRHIVEAHGGEVKAFSEGPGKGSEFLIRLPIVAE